MVDMLGCHESGGYLRPPSGADSPGAPRKSSWTTSDAPGPLFTFEERADLPDRGRPFPVVLAQSQLHVEQGHPGDNEEQGVGDQEGTWGTQRRSVTPGPLPGLVLPHTELADPLGPELQRSSFPCLPPPRLPKGELVVGKYGLRRAVRTNNPNGDDGCSTSSSHSNEVCNQFSKLWVGQRDTGVVPAGFS